MNISKSQFYSLPGKKHSYLIMTIEPIECRKENRKNGYTFEYHEFVGVKYSTAGGKIVESPPKWVIESFENWLESVKKCPEKMWRIKYNFPVKIDHTQMPRYKCKSCGYVFNWSVGGLNDVCRGCASENIYEIEKKYVQGKLF